MPSNPYRGIHPFRYLDRAIFFARDEETRRLANLVSVYRGVLLYGDSGSGKSSLVDAGLIPEAIRLGFAPERLRVQPRVSGELVVERIRSSDEEGEDDVELLPSVLALDEESSARTVLAIDALEERVRAACERHRPLLIFDQFEEIVTLFDEAGARDARQCLVELLVRLLRERLPVKVLFSFREDYLGRVNELLSACPELVDQALRLAPPTSDALPTIIRGPFERHPGQFVRELSPALSDRLITVLTERFGAGAMSLSEVQTVCLRLWQSDNPERLLTEKGPQGLLEDYLGEALDQMPTQLRATAIVLLTQMVTSAGTRNVLSAGDLFQRVREQNGRVTPSVFDQVLQGLSHSRLLRRERRRDLELYEITSEFLVPWISRRRDEFRQLQDRRRERRRLRILGSIAAALLLVAGFVGWLALDASQSAAKARSAKRQAQAQRNKAQAQRNSAISIKVAAESIALAHHQPLMAQLLAVAAWRIRHTSEARASLLNALAQPDRCLLAGRRHEYLPLHSVAFTSDGRELVTAGPGHVAQVWDVQACRLDYTFPPSRAAVTSVALSRDGKTLAVARADGTAQLYDMATHKRDGGALVAGPDRVTSVAFTQDGKTLATADASGTVRLWRVPASHRIRRFEAKPSGAVNSVAFSPDGRTLATADANGTVQLWWVPTGHRIRRFEAKPMGAVYSVAFSPDGRTLATGSADGAARLWDVATGQEEGVRLAVRSRSVYGVRAVYSVVFSPDARTLATGGADGTARLWDVATGEQVAGAPLTIGAIPVYSVAFSPNGRTLATANAAGAARLWDVADFRQIALGMTAGHGSSDSVAFSPDGRTLATADAEGTVQLWRIPAGRLIRTFSAPRTGAVYSVAFSPDGGTVATASADGAARLWDVTTGRQEGAPLKVSTRGVYSARAVYSVAFSRDGGTLATASADGKAELWDVATGREKGAPLHVSDRAVRSVAFSPDGRTLATASADGRAQLWDVATERRKGAPFSTSLPLESAAFSPYGGVFATAGEDGTVRLWNEAALRKSDANRSKGAPIAVSTPMLSVAFNPNGRILATASADGKVRLWDEAAHQQIGAALDAGPGRVTGLAFSRDGTILATASIRAGTKLWRVSLPHALVGHVCARAHKHMTLNQWKGFIPGGAAFQPVCQRY